MNFPHNYTISVHFNFIKYRHSYKWRPSAKWKTCWWLGRLFDALFIVWYGCNMLGACSNVPSHFLQNLSKFCLFIRPFEKRDVLCRGNVRPSVCPSVCPSVRPSVRVFRTFLQHALRYQFETWYIHSVGGATCRVWVASQLGHFDLVYSQK